MQLQVSIVSLYTRSLIGSDHLFLPLFRALLCAVPLSPLSWKSSVAPTLPLRQNGGSDTWRYDGNSPLHGAPRQLPRQTQPPAENSMACSLYALDDAGAGKEDKTNAAEFYHLDKDITSLPRRFGDWLRSGEVVGT